MRNSKEFLLLVCMKRICHNSISIDNRFDAHIDYVSKILFKLLFMLSNDVTVGAKTLPTGRSLISLVASQKFCHAL